MASAGSEVKKAKAEGKAEAPAARPAPALTLADLTLTDSIVVTYHTKDGLPPSAQERVLSQEGLRLGLLDSLVPCLDLPSLGRLCRASKDFNLIFSHEKVLDPISSFLFSEAGLTGSARTRGSSLCFLLPWRPRCLEKSVFPRPVSRLLSWCCCHPHLLL